MPTVQEIIDYVTGLAGRPLGGDEGVQHGSPETQISGATVSWMATPSALEAAGAAGHNLLISHESLYYPYGVLTPDDPPVGWWEWPINRRRNELLERYGLAFARLHGTLDHLCVCDAFAELLQLGEPAESDGLVRIYEGAGCTLRELVWRVKGRAEMPAVRVVRAGGWDDPVSRIGLPVGGLGLFVNVGYMEKLIERGCDVMIAGESDDYGFRFALESGVSMIETSHELSENPGMRQARDLLADRFPEVEFSFFPNTCPWEVV
jgi:putative NIF3 family GTP cyclohydrolase 1 type 2